LLFRLDGFDARGNVHACPPMTLGNMRENGFRRLDVSCWICHHSAVLDVNG
jgi:hypothetical protein